MFQSSVARMTLFGALLVGGMLLLERVAEPVSQRDARERADSGYRPDVDMRPIARVTGATPYNGSLRDIPAGFTIYLN